MTSSVFLCFFNGVVDRVLLLLLLLSYVQASSVCIPVFLYEFTAIHHVEPMHGMFVLTLAHVVLATHILKYRRLPLSPR